MCKGLDELKRELSAAGDIDLERDLDVHQHPNIKINIKININIIINYLLFICLFINLLIIIYLFSHYLLL